MLFTIIEYDIEYKTTEFSETQGLLVWSRKCKNGDKKTYFSDVASIYLPVEYIHNIIESTI